MKKKLPLIISLVIAFSLLIAGIYFARTGEYKTTQDTTDQIVISSPTKPESSPTPTEDGDPYSGWNTYNSDVLDITFKYPSDMKLQENPDNTVQLIKLGPTQKEGTELYDGISLTVRTAIYTGDFQDFVESERLESMDPIIDEITSLEEREIASLSGYGFTIVGLGMFDQIYLPLNSEEFVHISMLVSDPQNEGFAETVDLILASITSK